MNAQQKKLLLPIAILVLGLVSLIGAAFFILRDTGSKNPAAAVGGPFSMIDHHGARVSEANYRGGPMIVFFGFTHCPDVCPTTLFEMSEVLRLFPKERKVAALFVTVDPERDTAEKLKDYLSSFDARIFGLTGPRADVDAMLKTFRVYARKVPQEGGEYTMDHTAIVYLMDKQGRFVNALNMQQPPAQIAREIQRFF